MGKEESRRLRGLPCSSVRNVRCFRERNLATALLSLLSAIDTQAYQFIYPYFLKYLKKWRAFSKKYYNANIIFEFLRNLCFS